MLDLFSLIISPQKVGTAFCLLKGKVNDRLEKEDELTVKKMQIKLNAKFERNNRMSVSFSIVNEQ